MNEPNANTEVEKLDLSSLDVAELKRQELVELFPEVRTEGGKIDFERLKAVLGEMADAGRERYGMNWPGKAECMRTIQAPSMGTLLPMPDESVDWDTTENVIIEGDNLEALKLLQKSYLGKIKMIYIDPPYNTGNDFIYPDNFGESLQTYLEFTGQVDSEGRRFSTNVDSDGRFHSKWINMMYPRLFLARNLLREDGLIFISIDDGEADNLKKICNEIFGEECFVEQVVWKNKYGSGALTRGFANVHEYIFCYSKSPITNISAPLSEEAKAEYKLRDDKYAIRGGYITQPLATKSKDDRPNLRFPIMWNGREVWPEKQWIWSRERVETALRAGEIVFSDARGKVSVRVKQYLKDEAGNLRKGKPISILNGPFNQEGTKEVGELLGDDVFSFPKPSALIKYFLSFTVNEDESTDFFVLDLFAGSGSTGQAVLDLNEADGGNRKFILVQLPEEVEDGSAAAKAGHRTIADITRERVRKVLERIRLSRESQLIVEPAAPPPTGFRAYRLSTSNFIPWDGTASNDAEQLAKQLKLGIDHTRGDRTPQDLLFEVLLKSWGEPALSLKVGEETIEGVRVFSIAEGAFLICLEESVTLEFIRALAARKPSRVVMRESAFKGNDQLKANAVQTFKSQGVTSFKVV